MRYALRHWETFIGSTILPEKLSSAGTQVLQHLAELSAAERDNLRSNFMEDFYVKAKQKKMAFHIPFNQAVLTRLLDTLYRYKQVGNQPELHNFYDTISSHVIFILDFIEDYFGKYFDRTVKVPVSYLAVSRREILTSIAELEQILSARKEIEPALRQLLLDNFTRFCNSNSSPNYNDLIYQKALLKELLDLKRIPADTDARDMITEMLVYMNFNHPGFMAYYMDGVNADIKDIKTAGGKQETLQHLEAVLRLQPERPGAVLRPGAPSAKSVLLLALETQAGHLKNGTVVKPAGTAYPATLISVPFKGSEIYLLHKSFIDAGGAPQEIYKSLLEKTAGHLGNKTQKGFSAESLVKYSDKVDPESKDSVKRFLQKMIRNIESYD